MDEYLIEPLCTLISILENKYGDKIIPEDPSEEDANLLLAAKSYLTNLLRKHNA